MKEKDKESQLSHLTRELTANFDRWDHLYKHGGQDPFYEDGVNLNLVRNHILYDKNAMKELIAADSDELNLFALSYPDIYYRETPPKVPYNYMANPDEIRKRAQEQIALYEKDPNFQYCLENQSKVFPEGKETKATKEAGLSIGRIRRFSRYRQDIERDDLVAMRRDFYEPYESKAVQWAENAKALKSFLEKEHSPDDDVVVVDDWEEEDTCYEEEEQEVEEPPEPKANRKPSLDSRIHSAQAAAASKEKSHEPRAEQLSFF